MLPGFDVLQVFFRHCRLLIINTHQELKVTVSLKITLMLQRLVKRMSGVSVSATRPPSEREGSQRYMHVQLIKCDDVMSLVCSHNLHHVKQIVTDLGSVFTKLKLWRALKLTKCQFLRNVASFLLEHVHTDLRDVFSFQFSTLCFSALLVNTVWKGNQRGSDFEALCLHA